MILADWWMDDWITHVYGNERTCVLATVSVGHRTSPSHYDVQKSHECFVEPLLYEGRARVAAYIDRIVT